MLACTLPDARKYREFAVRELSDCFVTQFDPDGSHKEHTMGYHRWMSDVQTSYALLAKRHPELGLEISPETAVRAWDYSLGACCCDGREAGLNDEGRWHPNQKPVNLAAMLEYRNRVAKELGVDSPYDTQATLHAFPNAGQYFFADEAGKPDASMLIYDATVFGGWHCHVARQSVNYFDGQRMVLTDGGSFNYNHDDIFTLYGKNTPSHNTITVEGLSQSLACDAKVHTVYDSGQYSLIASTYHGGYAVEWDPLHRQPPKAVSASHSRLAAWKKHGFVLVVDSMLFHDGGHEYESHWQYYPMQVRAEKQGGYAPEADFAVRALYCTDPVSCTIYEGSEEPFLGYVAKDGLKLAGESRRRW